MIFISDLDKTLIFSKRHLPTTQKLLLAELKNNEPYSFMTNNAFDKLKDFIENGGIFIPATARTLEQYKRITVFNSLHLKYEIICNGKTILINGEKDETWEKLMNEKLTSLPISLQELFPTIKDYIINNINSNGNNYYIYENYMGIISFPSTNFLNKKMIDNLNNIIDYSGWQVSSGGRKLYICPPFINKANALKYIQQKIYTETNKLEKILASGDSFYDLQMLKKSDFSIIPKHSEITEELPTTNNSFFNASNEILNYVKTIQIYLENNK